MGFFSRFSLGKSGLLGACGAFFRRQSLKIYSLGTALVVLASLGVLFQWKEEPVAATPVLAADSLSCHDIYRIFYWSRDHFGGSLGGGAELFGSEWSPRVLDLYLQKLDPYKMLFTAGEAGAFRADGVKRWKELLSSQRCDFFETWVQSHWGQARQRFDKTLQSASIDEVFTAGKTSAKASDDEELHLVRPTAFASSEAELQNRVRQAMKQVAVETTPALLVAYKMDRARLVRDTLEQGLFGDAPLSPHTLLVKAFLGSLDSYSTYFSSQEFEDFYHDLAGGTSGIGIKVRSVPNGLLIEKLIPDSPAEASKKVKAGDVIVSVDGVSLAGLPAASARALLKGGEHTKVTLRLRTAARDRSVTLERERFSFDDGKITSRVVNRPGAAVGIIDIPSFYGRAGRTEEESERSSSEDLKGELTRLLDPGKKVAALVLDLRGNPGGFLEEAVSMAGFFLGDRPVVAVVENHRRRIMKEAAAQSMYDGPLVVLVDGDSASASEVLTGALKDYQRAVVVGSVHTYGKGCVQRLFHLDDQFLDLEMGMRSDRGVVKLTTSIFYSPLGHSPANGGVASDIALSMKGPADGDADAALAPDESRRVPEQSPVIGDAIASQIKRLEPAHRDEIDFLRRREKTREKDLPSSAQAMAADELNKSDGKGADAELAEAVAIAGDLAMLDQKPSGPQVTRK